MSNDKTQTTNLERAMNQVIQQQGSEGVRAIATFMHALGSGATLVFEDGGGWVPCDFVMQAAWAFGGTKEQAR